MDSTSWVLVVVALVHLGVLGAGLYLRSYLVKKGENLATREDLAELTTAVEEIRAQFATQQDHYRHLLARHLEEHRLSLETELPIYQSLWDRVLAMDGALSALQIAFAVNGSMEDRQAALARFEHEKEALNAEMKRVKPFIAPEVLSKLFRAFLIMRKVAAESQLVLQGTSPARFQVISDGISETSEAFQVLATTIRSRLYPAVSAGDKEPGSTGT